MRVSDILKAIALMQMQKSESDFTIEKIENHFIYLSNSERIPFRDIDGFFENTTVKTAIVADITRVNE